MKEYSYGILKYRPSLCVGECLNFGVVLYDDKAMKAYLALSSDVRRLALAFPGFDERAHDVLMGNLRYALSGKIKTLNAGTLMQSVWVDQGLSYYYSYYGLGVGNDLDAELDSIFNCFVSGSRFAANPDPVKNSLGRTKAVSGTK